MFEFLGSWWTVFGGIVLLAASAGVTYLIDRFKLSEKIGGYVDHIDGIGIDADALRMTVVKAFRPDPVTGQVVLTKEEMEEILHDLDELLENFGIDLFDNEPEEPEE